MSWIGAYILGIFLYLFTYLLGFVLFVECRLANQYPDLVVAFAEVLSIPSGRGENYNFTLDLCFWAVIFACIFRLTSRALRGAR